MSGFKSDGMTPDPYLELERRDREIEALRQQNAELQVVLDDLLLDLVRISAKHTIH